MRVIIFMEFNFKLCPGKNRLQRNLIKEGKPLLSIITPYYNAGKYIRQTANCVFNQTFPYFEWIIVNDGSTNKDDIKILSELQNEDDRIKIYHKENGGISTARNLAIKKSTTEIIVPLDADDLIEPTYLECIYWSLYCNPDASWAYTDNIGFFNQEYLWRKSFNSDVLKTYNFLTYSAGIRKKDLEEVGFYDEIEKHYYEDWTLWLKLLSKGKYPIHMNWYGFWYRRTDTGVLGTINSDKKRHERAMEIIKENAKHIKKSVEAIEYPRYKPINFKKPYKWEWNRKPILGKEKIKVLMMIPHMQMGGADIFNLDLVSRIDKEKFEISIIATNPGDSSWRQRFEEHVTDIFDLTTFLDVKDWSAFIHYFIKSRDIDIVFISNSYYGYYITPWLRKEFPNIAIIDYVHMEEWYWRAGGYARTSGVIGDIIEKTYVCNEHLRQVLIKHFNKKPEDVETLYIGVDEKEFNKENIERGQVRKQLGIDEKRPIVLFPCRIHPQKRPFLMLEIAKATKKVIPDICFFVVGDGEQLEEVKEKIKKEKLQDTVYILGRQIDMKPYYRDSDVTLICSLKEGLALTSYESLSMGVPVISSDVGGQRELIDNSIGRILPLLQDEANDLDKREYKKEEIEQYVKAIVDILKDRDKYKEMSKRCRERIEQGFTKDKMIKKIEKEFIELKEGKGKEKREKISNAINLLPNLIDDYITLYCEYFLKDNEAEEVWKAKLYFENLAKSKNVCEEKNNNFSYIDIYAKQELERIYSMRTWKLIQKYRKLMDETSVGFILCKFRDFLLNNNK